MMCPPIIAQFDHGTVATTLPFSFLKCVPIQQYLLATYSMGSRASKKEKLGSFCWHARPVVETQRSERGCCLEAHRAQSTFASSLFCISPGECYCCGGTRQFIVPHHGAGPILQNAKRNAAVNAFWYVWGFRNYGIPEVWILSKTVVLWTTSHQTNPGQEQKPTSQWAYLKKGQPPRLPREWPKQQKSFS